MIVGFTIVDVKGHEKELSSFIQKVCILESPDIADNIVAAGNGVNVFTMGLDSMVTDDGSIKVSRDYGLTEGSSILDKNIADYIEPISTKDGYQIVANATNFNLEVTYNGKILRLVPTEYIYITPDEIPQFTEYEKQGLVRFIPYVTDLSSNWILEDGTWNDDGKWVDYNYWRDGS